MKKSLKEIRKEYIKGSISIGTTPANPLELLEIWLQEAIEVQVEEPTAMTLSTVSIDNFPSSRVVLLKEITKEGLVFFTNYHSQKGREIALSPNVSINFFWPELERQVRVQAMAEKLLSEESDEYFYSRPLASQAGAIVSNQSQVIEESLNLEAQVEELLKQEVPLVRPENWGGYLLVPKYCEFWHGKPSRVHDRVAFNKSNNEWHKCRLSP
jgi:pyridoxamine 5'-phosphate oxidase